MIYDLADGLRCGSVVFEMRMVVSQRQTTNHAAICAFFVFWPFVPRVPFFGFASFAWKERTSQRSRRHTRETDRQQSQSNRAVPHRTDRGLAYLDQ